MFGQNLKQLRANKKINQVQLAEELGVNQGTIAKWETDRRTPDTEMLKRISGFFGVTVDYLLRNEREQIPETRLLARYSKLSEEEKAEFNNTVDIYFKAKGL